MPYTKAILELRQMIADTDINKRSTKKKLIGDVDGINNTFTTFDKRVIESSLKVYVDNQKVDFTLEDAIAGEIEICDPPDKGQTVTATYYWQWWVDAELINFLNKGGEIIGQIDQSTKDQAYLNIPGGLKNSALKYAAHLANTALYEYLIARRHSQEFALEQDGGDDQGYAQLVGGLQKSSAQFLKDALALRDDFYKAQGRQFKPSFGIKVVKTRQYGPTR